MKGPGARCRSGGGIADPLVHSFAGVGLRADEIRRIHLGLEGALGSARFALDVHRIRAVVRGKGTASGGKLDAVIVCNRCGADPLRGIPLR